MIGVSAISEMTCLSRFLNIGAISLHTLGKSFSMLPGASIQHRARCMSRWPSEVTILACICSCSALILAISFSGSLLVSFGKLQAHRLARA